VIYFTVTLQRRICLPPTPRPQPATSPVGSEEDALREARGCEPVPVPAALLTLTPESAGTTGPGIPAAFQGMLSETCERGGLT